MKKTGRLVSIVLILALLCPAVFAYAGDDAADKVVLSKSLVGKDSQVSLPTADFTFRFTPIVPGTAFAVGGADVTKTAAISDQVISFTTEDTSATKTLDITQTVIDAIETSFAYGGIYAWTVSEQQGTSANIVYDTDTYLLVAYAQFFSTDLPLYYTFSIWHENSEKQMEKVDKLAFTNGYNKEIDPDVDNDLMILNQVYNESKTKRIPGVPFSYTLTISSVDGSAFPKDTYEYRIHGETKHQAYNEPLKFDLYDADCLFVNGLYEGAVVNITEGGQAGYTMKATYGNYPDGEYAVTPVRGEDITISGFRIPGKGGIVSFLNLKDEATPTQFMIDNLPFVVLIAVSLCGLVLYIVIRRRRRSYDA